ncbi:peptidoglycan editing factor PgeF [Candidatus Methylocalor cossyra]|uniref:Purine nucleoside phosphorylase n=1 Tax=Candidatus Methylocalor cossyra TaxID=3108543 RepID=A0ABP1C8H8_9GAMM
MSVAWIEPDWPAPPGVRAATSLRVGGVSRGPYASLNLGAQVGDDPGRVEENRRRLADALGLPAEPVWLQQVHGCRAVRADQPAPMAADAAWTDAVGVVCAVMTADCLPVLLCTRDGGAVAAIHAGWRGLATGVIESTLAALGRGDLMAWLGPAIGPEAFEVGGEVRAAFLRNGPDFAAGFREAGADRWRADLYCLARLILVRQGLSDRAIYGGGWCTFANPRAFFSHRRDRITGRMATLIWREGH